MVLGALVPVCLFCVYSFDLSDETFDKKTDTNYTLMLAAGAYNTSLTPFGIGMRDGFTSTIGYVMEILMVGLYYNLLFNTYQIHNTFREYLYLLMDM